MNHSSSVRRGRKEGPPLAVCSASRNRCEVVEREGRFNESAGSGRPPGGRTPEEAQQSFTALFPGAPEQSRLTAGLALDDYLRT